MSSKTKVTKRQRTILEKLIYPEPFEKVREETGMEYGELRDELIQLVNHGYAIALDKDADDEITMHYYDTDNLEYFAFRATSQGLSAINI